MLPTMNYINVACQHRGSLWCKAFILRYEMRRSVESVRNLPNTHFRHVTSYLRPCCIILTSAMTEIARSTEDFLESQRGDMDSVNIVENGATSTEADPVPEEKTTKEGDKWMDVLGSGQIMKKILIEGAPNCRPTQGDLCEISIEGKLSNGTVVEKAESKRIHLGDGEVVQGVDLVLALMNEGEKAVVEIGPRFAYGTQGRVADLPYPDIPPDQTLTYTIELKSVRIEPPMEEIPISERKKIGNRKRERGNWWYGRHEHTLAIHSYRRALDYLDEAVGGITVETKDPDEREEDTLRELLEDRLKVYNNLAAAQLRIGALDAGLSSVNNVLRCQPDNVKAIYRKSKILSEKGDLTSALEWLQKVIELDPNNGTFRKEMKNLKSKVEMASQQEKKLYRKMLGGSPPVSRSRAEQEGDSTSRSKLFPWGMVVGSVAVVVAGVVAYRYKFI